MHILLLQTYSSKPTPDYDKIALELRSLGHIVWVGTPNHLGEIEWHSSEGIAARIPVTKIPYLPDRLAMRLAKIPKFINLRRLIRKVKPDVVQVNTYDLLLFLPVGMPRNISFILDFRQINEMYGITTMEKLEAAIRNKLRTLISRHLYAQTTFLHPAGARQVLGDEWSRWGSVVPMGVDPHFLAAEPIRSDESGADRPVSFIYIGSLARWRQLELLLEAATLVRRETKRFRIVFLGHDFSEGYYSSVIQRLDLNDIVSIQPPIPYEDVPKAVLRHDVALAYVPELPADWQYHPTLKILEYRALGMPIIATDFLPNRELVIDGDNGVLVKNTAEDISQAMLRFICDPDFLPGSRAKAQAMREGLTWDKVAFRYYELYQRLHDERV